MLELGQELGGRCVTEYSQFSEGAYGLQGAAEVKSKEEVRWCDVRESC